MRSRPTSLRTVRVLTRSRSASSGPVQSRGDCSSDSRRRHPHPLRRPVARSEPSWPRLATAARRVHLHLPARSPARKPELGCTRQRHIPDRDPLTERLGHLALPAQEIAHSWHKLDQVRSSKKSKTVSVTQTGQGFSRGESCLGSSDATEALIRTLVSQMVPEMVPECSQGLTENSPIRP